MLNNKLKPLFLPTANAGVVWHRMFKFFRHMRDHKLSSPAMDRYDVDRTTPQEWQFPQTGNSDRTTGGGSVEPTFPRRHLMEEMFSTAEIRDMWERGESSSYTVPLWEEVLSYFEHPFFIYGTFLVYIWRMARYSTEAGADHLAQKALDDGFVNIREWYKRMPLRKGVSPLKYVPSYEEWFLEAMCHGDYDEYWHKQNILPHLKNIRHSILNVAGWFDAEDFYGPMSIYYTIEQKNPENKSTLVVGPWRHGGWARMDGDELGDIKFVEKTGQYFREEIEFPFFKYHLKEKGELNLSEAIVFETGSNRLEVVVVSKLVALPSLGAIEFVTE